MCLACYEQHSAHDTFHYGSGDADADSRGGVLHVLHADTLCWELPFDTSRCSSLPNTLLECFVQHADRPLLGTRNNNSSSYNNSNNNNKSRNNNNDSSNNNTLNSFYEFRSYSQVHSDVLRASNVLTRHYGLHRGDVVVLCAAACYDWYVLQWACFYTGIIVATPAHNVSLLYFAAVAQKCRPALIACSRHLVSYAAAVVATHKAHVLLLTDAAVSYELRHDESATDLPTEAKQWPSLTSLLQTARPDYVIPPLPAGYEDEVVMLLPTSGTTGSPKLVMVTDRMMRRSVTTTSQAVEMVLISHQPLRQAIGELCKGAKIGIW